MLRLRSSTFSSALISDKPRRGAYTYDSRAGRSEQPRVRSPLTHAYMPSASVERYRPRSCAAQNAASRRGCMYASESGTKGAAFVGRHTARGAPAKSGSAMYNDWSGIEGEEGVRVGS